MSLSSVTHMLREDVLYTCSTYANLWGVKDSHLGQEGPAVESLLVLASFLSLTYRAGMEQLYKLLWHSQHCHFLSISSQTQSSPTLGVIILFPIYCFISSFYYVLAIPFFSLFF